MVLEERVGRYFFLGGRRSGCWEGFFICFGIGREKLVVVLVCFWVGR